MVYLSPSRNVEPRGGCCQGLRGSRRDTGHTVLTGKSRWDCDANNGQRAGHSAAWLTPGAERTGERTTCRYPRTDIFIATALITTGLAEFRAQRDALFASHPQFPIPRGTAFEGVRYFAPGGRVRRGPESYGGGRYLTDTVKGTHGRGVEMLAGDRVRLDFKLPLQPVVHVRRPVAPPARPAGEQDRGAHPRGRTEIPLTPFL